MLLTMATSIILSSLVLSTFVRTQGSYKRASALSLAEAGIEKTIWELNKSLTPSCTSLCSLESGDFIVSIENIDSQTKDIISTGYIPNQTNYVAKKTVKVRISANPSTQGIAFSYAIQSGTGGITVGGSSEVVGNLYSNGNITVGGSGQVTGNAWAVGTITGGSRITGSKYPGSPATNLPQVDLNTWRDLAKAGGTITGNYSPPGSGSYTNLGPKEITGDFSMSTSSKVNLTGPLYIHGNLSVSGGAEWKLDDNFGSKGTIVLVDGTIIISGSTKFYSNSSGSYILFISASTSGSAITYAGSATGEKLALYAYNGGMTLAGSGEIVAMTGKTLTIAGSGEIHYESGLAMAEFSGGPGGSWVKQSWQEINQ